MPIYAYQCQSCGPDCGNAGLKRLVSAAAFRLKGGGWYETDFKKGDKKNLHETSTGTSPVAKKSAPDSGKAAGTKKTESAPKTSKSTAD